jgi:hypothetical protein
MELNQPITTLPIRIAQLNTQRKKTVITQLLNNNCNDFDIILVQEPNWGLIGKDPTSGDNIYGPVALQGWSVILPVPVTDRTRRRPRTLTYYRPRQDFQITLRSDIIEDNDIQVLDITQTNLPTVTVINVYNDTPKGEECILHRIRQIDNIICQRPTVITGDFNLHHPLWS